MPAHQTLALEQVTFPGAEWVVREKGGAQGVMRRYTADEGAVQFVWIRAAAAEAVGFSSARGDRLPEAEYAVAVVVSLPPLFVRFEYSGLCLWLDDDARFEYDSQKGKYDEIFTHASQARWHAPVGHALTANAPTANAPSTHPFLWRPCPSLWRSRFVASASAPSCCDWHELGRIILEIQVRSKVRKVSGVTSGCG